MKTESVFPCPDTPYKMVYFTLDNARELRKSVLENTEEQAQQIAEDLARQSKTLEEAFESVKWWIHNHPDKTTIMVNVLNHPILDMNTINRIGAEKINQKLKKLLEDKYREAFPDFRIEADEDMNFVFYLRVTFHSV
jgi:hypothetical protein